MATTRRNRTEPHPRPRPDTNEDENFWDFSEAYTERDRRGALSARPAPDRTAAERQRKEAQREREAAIAAARREEERLQRMQQQREAEIQRAREAAQRQAEMRREAEEEKRRAAQEALREQRQQEAQSARQKKPSTPEPDEQEESLGGESPWTQAIRVIRGEEQGPRKANLLGSIWGGRPTEKTGGSPQEEDEPILPLGSLEMPEVDRSAPISSTQPSAGTQTTPTITGSSMPARRSYGPSQYVPQQEDVQRQLASMGVNDQQAFDWASDLGNSLAESMAQGVIGRQQVFDIIGNVYNNSYAAASQQMEEERLRQQQQARDAQTPEQRQAEFAKERDAGVVNAWHAFRAQFPDIADAAANFGDILRVGMGRYLDQPGRWLFSQPIRGVPGPTPDQPGALGDFVGAASSTVEEAKLPKDANWVARTVGQPFKLALGTAGAIGGIMGGDMQVQGSDTSLQDNVRIIQAIRAEVDAMPEGQEKEDARAALASNYSGADNLRRMIDLIVNKDEYARTLAQHAQAALIAGDPWTAANLGAQSAALNNLTAYEIIQSERDPVTEIMVGLFADPSNAIPVGAAMDMWRLWRAGRRFGDPKLVKELKYVDEAVEAWEQGLRASGEPAGQQLLKNIPGRPVGEKISQTPVVSFFGPTRGARSQRMQRQAFRLVSHLVSPWQGITTHDARLIMNTLLTNPKQLVRGIPLEQFTTPSILQTFRNEGVFRVGEEVLGQKAIKDFWPILKAGQDELLSLPVLNADGVLDTRSFANALQDITGDAGRRLYGIVDAKQLRQVPVGSTKFEVKAGPRGQGWVVDFLTQKGQKLGQSGLYAEKGVAQQVAKEMAHMASASEHAWPTRVLSYPMDLTRDFMNVTFLGGTGRNIIKNAFNAAAGTTSNGYMSFTPVEDLFSDIERLFGPMLGSQRTADAKAGAQAGAWSEASKASGKGPRAWLQSGWRKRLMQVPYGSTEIPIKIGPFKVSIPVGEQNWWTRNWHGSLMKNWRNQMGDFLTHEVARPLIDSGVPPARVREIQKSLMETALTKGRDQFFTELRRVLGGGRPTPSLESMGIPAGMMSNRGLGMLQDALKVYTNPLATPEELAEAQNLWRQAFALEEMRYANMYAQNAPPPGAGIGQMGEILGDTADFTDALTRIAQKAGISTDSIPAAVAEFGGSQERVLGQLVADMRLQNTDPVQAKQILSKATQDIFLARLQQRKAQWDIEAKAAAAAKEANHNRQMVGQIHQRAFQQVQETGRVLSEQIQQAVTEARVAMAQGPQPGATPFFPQATANWLDRLTDRVSVADTLKLFRGKYPTTTDEVVRLGNAATAMVDRAYANAWRAFQVAEDPIKAFDDIARAEEMARNIQQTALALTNKIRNQLYAPGAAPTGKKGATLTTKIMKQAAEDVSTVWHSAAEAIKQRARATFTYQASDGKTYQVISQLEDGKWRIRPVDGSSKPFTIKNKAELAPGKEDLKRWYEINKPPAEDERGMLDMLEDGEHAWFDDESMYPFSPKHPIRYGPEHSNGVTKLVGSSRDEQRKIIENKLYMSQYDEYGGQISDLTGQRAQATAPYQQRMNDLEDSRTVVPLNKYQEFMANPDDDPMMYFSGVRGARPNAVRNTNKKWEYDGEALSDEELQALGPLVNIKTGLPQRPPTWEEWTEIEHQKWAIGDEMSVAQQPFDEQIARLETLRSELENLQEGGIYYEDAAKLLQLNMKQSTEYAEARALRDKAVNAYNNFINDLRDKVVDPWSLDFSTVNPPNGPAYAVPSNWDDVYNHVPHESKQLLREAASYVGYENLPDDLAELTYDQYDGLLNELVAEQTRVSDSWQKHLDDMMDRHGAAERELWRTARFYEEPGAIHSDQFGDALQFYPRPGDIENMDVYQINDAGERVMLPNDFHSYDTSRYNGKPIKAVVYQGRGPAGKGEGGFINGLGQYFAGNKEYAQRYFRPGGALDTFIIELQNPVLIENTRYLGTKANRRYEKALDWAIDQGIDLGEMEKLFNKYGMWHGANINGEIMRLYHQYGLGHDGMIVPNRNFIFVKWTEDPHFGPSMYIRDANGNIPASKMFEDFFKGSGPKVDDTFVSTMPRTGLNDLANSLQKAFLLDDGDAQLLKDLIGTRAMVWSYYSGKPPEEYYTKAFGEISRFKSDKQRNATINLTQAQYGLFGAYNPANKQTPRVALKSYLDEFKRLGDPGARHSNLEVATHELAHMWMTELSVIARQDNAAMRDYMLLHNWAQDRVLAGGTDRFAKVGVDLEYSIGEVLAESFNRYLATGQAPVPELQNVFERFWIWAQEIINRVRRYTNFYSNQYGLDTALNDMPQEIMDAYGRLFKVPDQPLNLGPDWQGDYSEIGTLWNKRTDTASINMGAEDAMQAGNAAGFMLDDINRARDGFAAQMDNARAGALQPDANGLNPAVGMNIMSGLGSFNQRWDNMLARAASAADDAAEFTMLEPSNVRNFDTVLRMFMPYHYFWSRSAKNWAQRAIADPRVANFWHHAQQQVEMANNRADAQYGEGVMPLRGQDRYQIPWTDLFMTDPSDIVLPFNSYGANEFVDPETAVNQFERNWLTAKQWTPLGGLPMDLAMSAYLDKTAPRPEGAAPRTLDFGLADIFPQVRIPELAYQIYSGKPAPTAISGDPFMYGTAGRAVGQMPMEKFADQLPPGTTPEEWETYKEWANDVGHQRQQGLPALPEQPELAIKIWEEGVRQSGVDKLLAHALGMLFGPSFVQIRDTELDARAVQALRRTLGYSEENPYGSQAAIDELDKLTGGIHRAMAMYSDLYPSDTGPDEGEIDYGRPGIQAAKRMKNAESEELYSERNNQIDAIIDENWEMDTAKEIQDLTSPVYDEYDKKIDALGNKYPSADDGPPFEMTPDFFKNYSPKELQDYAIDEVDQSAKDEMDRFWEQAGAYADAENWDAYYDMVDGAVEHETQWLMKQLLNPSVMSEKVAGLDVLPISESEARALAEKLARKGNNLTPTQQKLRDRRLSENVQDSEQRKIMDAHWDAYNKLPNGTGAKGEYMRNNPDFAAYYLEKYPDNGAWWNEEGSGSGSGKGSGKGGSNYTGDASDAQISKWWDEYRALGEDWDAKKQYMLDNPEFAAYYKSRGYGAWWEDDGTGSGGRSSYAGSSPEYPDRWSHDRPGLGVRHTADWSPYDRAPRVRGAGGAGAGVGGALGDGDGSAGSAYLRSLAQSRPNMGGIQPYQPLGGAAMPNPMSYTMSDPYQIPGRGGEFSELNLPQLPDWEFYTRQLMGNRG